MAAAQLTKELLRTEVEQIAKVGLSAQAVGEFDPQFLLLSTSQIRERVAAKMGLPAAALVPHKQAISEITQDILSKHFSREHFNRAHDLASGKHDAIADRGTASPDGTHGATAPGDGADEAVKEAAAAAHEGGESTDGSTFITVEPEVRRAAATAAPSSRAYASRISRGCGVSKRVLRGAVPHSDQRVQAAALAREPVLRSGVSEPRASSLEPRASRLAAFGAPPPAV